jgi:group I intron endonuclease
VIPRNKDTLFYFNALRLLPRRAYGVVYLLTNIDTGRSYVGQTTQAVPFDRIFTHRKSALSGNSSNILHRAIRKYGWSAFRIEIIANCDNRKALDAAEAYFIELYQTMSPNGYNMKHGGAKGRFSEQFKRKLRRVHSAPKVSQKHRETITACWADPAHMAKLKVTWKVKNALSAPARAEKKRVKREAWIATKPERLAKKNAAIKAAHSRPEVKEKVGRGTRNSRWICRGIASQRLKLGEPLPKGWNFGRGASYERS